MPPQEILVCAKPSAARRVAGVLRSRGYAVETAGDGGRAVEGAERHNPAVVLIWSDLRGLETSAVVRRVREASGAKVAVIVKREAADRASTFLEAGADAIVPDGRDLDRLARTVDRLLEGGLVTDRALDLPGDAFEPEEPVVNGNGRHPENDVDSAADPEVEQTSPDLSAEGPPEPGIDFQPCDVAEIVQEGAAEAARGHPAVVVQVTAPPRLPATAHTAALRGAVRALIEEACRGSEAGSDVTVKAQRVDAGIFVLVADRGPGPDEAIDDEPAAGFALARALIALHGGILAAEPIPSGGRRVSFTIPEEPLHLEGVELQGAFRALELLEETEAAREQEPEPNAVPEDDGQLIEQAIDLAAAAADAAALAPEPTGRADPIRSLVELFGFEPEPVQDEEPEVEEVAEVEEVPELEVEEVPELEVEDTPEPELEEVPELEVEEVPELEGEDTPEPELEEVPELDEPEPEPEPVQEEDEKPPAAVVTLPPPDEAPDPETVSEPEPVEIPEPVLAAEASSSEPVPAPQRPVEPPKAFVPNPLHPATAILRALAEEYDDQSNRFRGR
jgi:DNA-binding NarL/FixJ family response regulator